MDVATESLPVGRRDRKKRETHLAIIEAALDLFEEKGVAATTVDEIAERADVAQRTFFRHFATKDAVLYPTPEERQAAIRTALAARPPDEPLVSAVLHALGTAADIPLGSSALAVRRWEIMEHEGLGTDAMKWAAVLEGTRLLEEEIARHAGLAVDDDEVRLVAGLGLLVISQALADLHRSDSPEALADLIDRKHRDLRRLLARSRLAPARTSPPGR